MRPMLVAMALLLAACGGDARTEVLLSVTSDFTIPAELDRLTVTAAGPGMDIQTARATLTSPADLPATLGLVHEGGPLAPFDVTIDGFAGEALEPVATRRARFQFQAGQTLELRIHLSRACSGVSCAGDETCEAGECRSIDVLPSELRPWMPNDAGTDAGDAATDAATDAGDASTDSGSRDSGVDSGTGSDTGITPDATSPSSCAETYGTAPQYSLCAERADECEFYTAPSTAASCEATCEVSSGTCIGSYEPRNRGAGSCDRMAPRDCATAGDSFICICTRR